ncbi:MAG: hypothetical protein WCV58_04230 [Patescibacteria group bacterium]
MGNETWMEREAQRQELVRKAVGIIDQMILDISDGSEQKLQKMDELTGLVFEALVMTRNSHNAASIKVTTICSLTVAAVDKIDQFFTQELRSLDVVKDYLWMQVVQKFAEKVMCPYAARLQKWDMEHPAENNWPNSARDPHP